MAPPSRLAIEAHASWDRSMVPWHAGEGQRLTIVTVTVPLPGHGIGTP